MSEASRHQGEAHILFQEWLDRRLVDGKERDPASICADRPELLPDLMALIEGFQAIDQVLPSPTRDLGGGFADAVPEPPRIDGYEMGGLIGQGGMGEVWQAEQVSPVRRSVALKVIKPRPNLDRVTLRFEFERQAQAAMEHPAIARIFDAGITDDGRPFFSMERVQGQSITEYCDQHRLTIQQRLELFVQVCDGVLHAHHKGLIHRDLKPSNILVTQVDGEPQPKIIDFGIAKAVVPLGGDHATLTEQGQLVGTPAYMSPEQASLANAADVDTRSDVYSLGVVLFELLVGERPFPMDGPFGGGSRDTEPEAPSSRVSQLGARAEKLAHLRDVPRSKLSSLLRGDVDWIVLKALEPKRDDRYDSPAELAADLRRYFRDEPVWAGPAGSAYRFKKLVRRHRTAVGAIALVLFALLGTLAGLGIGLERALRAERKAVEESALAQSASEFLVKLFEQTNPTSRDAQPTARALLDQGMERLDQELKSQPVLRARMQESMGRAYRGLGAYKEAAELIEDALAFRRGRDDGESLALSETLFWMADVKSEQGDLEKARELAAESLALRETAGGTSIKTAESLQQLGVIRWRQGEFKEALEHSEAALATRERLLGEDHESLAPLLNNIANLAIQQGDVERGERLFWRALNIFEGHFGPDHPNVASNLNNLGIFKGNHGDPEASVELHRRALNIRQATLAPDHPDLGETYNNLGTALTDLGRFDEAKGALVKALEIREKALGKKHFLYISTVFNLGRLQVNQKDYVLARGRLEESLRLFQESMGAEHPIAAFPLLTLAFVDREEGELERALAKTRQVIELRKSFAPDASPLMKPALELARDLLVDLGRDGEAEPFRQRLAALDSNPG